MFLLINLFIISSVNLTFFKQASQFCNLVISYFTTGEKLRIVTLPATKITSCCFGGPKFDILYVTTSTHHMTTEEAANQPLAGSIFAVKNLGVKGLPANAYQD